MDPVSRAEPLPAEPASKDLQADDFRSLFDLHLGPVWRFARRRCGSADDADDIVADTFAVAWRRREDLPPSDEVGLWLFGVARRVLANQRRSADRRARLHQRLATTAVTESTVGPPADLGAEREHRLRDALARLHPDDRELLLLRAWDGLSVPNIAVLLDCTPNAVSIRLHRARGRLAALLDVKEPPTSWTSAGRPTERKEDMS
ncbi:MAG: RNA polymerase sigma factor [Aquihabitans sp.]